MMPDGNIVKENCFDSRPIWVVLPVFSVTKENCIMLSLEIVVHAVHTLQSYIQAPQKPFRYLDETSELS